MTRFSCFLSVVMVMRNTEADVEQCLRDATRVLSGLVDLYELIVIDNASADHSVAVLERLTAEEGLANLQVFALTKEVDSDTASWVGLENALGDFVVVLDPLTDDIGFVPCMLDKALAGMDAVFAKNTLKTRERWPYRMASAAFNRLYQYLGGIHLANEAPSYRMLSKRLVNFILQHPKPALTCRPLPATSGFNRYYLEYSAQPRSSRPKRLGESIGRGARLLVSTTDVPMRLVTLLCLLGAGANALYCIYVLGVAVLKTDIAPGWLSVSLQQSGMFFLISLVLLILGEYVLNIVRLSVNAPLYHVAHELTSTRMNGREKLNVHEPPVHPAPSPGSGERSLP